MKIKMLSDLGCDMRPKFKCGFLSAIADGVSDALGGGLVSGLLGTAGAAFTNQLTRDNMRLQTNLQKDLQKQSSELSQANWKEQFDMQNEYNTPEKQVGRLLDAGINPFVNNSTASPVAGTSPSVAGAPVGVGNAVGFAGPSLNLTGDLRNLVSAAKEAKGIPFVQQQIEAEIKRFLANARSDEAKAELDEIAAGIQREFGQKNAAAALKLLNKRVDEVQSIIDRNDMEGLLAWKTGLLRDAEQSLTANKVNEFRQYVDKLYRLYESQITANTASANQANTQAGVNREIRTEKILENGLNAALFNGKIEQFSIALDKLEADKEISASQVDVARAAAAVAQYEKDNAAMLFWRDFILETLGKSVDIVSAVRSWKNISSYSSLSESKKREVDLQVQKFDREILEKKAGKKVERTRRTSQGNVKETYYQNK